MTRVLVIHQHDPAVDHVGGIATFINSFIKNAPSDFEVKLIGTTSDPRRRPVGRWDRLNLGKREFDFLPLVAGDPRKRTRVPLSLKLTLALWRHRRSIPFQDAILKFHRIEPTLALRNLTNPKVLFMHGHMKDLYNPQTEITWGRFPWLYFRLEQRLIGAMDHIYLIREDAVSFYRERHPAIQDRFSFLPTWVDETVFSKLPEEERQSLREKLTRQAGVDPNSRLLLFVGRFEGQKDPFLLLEAFRRLNGALYSTTLILIGTGTLEGSLRAYIERENLGDRVRILGPQPQVEVSRWMNVADCLCLSSAFEGMPMVAVEALYCGLPVVSTDVGETKRLIQHPAIGRLVKERTPETFSAALFDLLRQKKPDREACQRQAAAYTAGKILEPVYEYFRLLGRNGS